MLINKNICKRIILPILFLCLFISSVSSAKYSGGSGIESDPYLISNRNDLLELAYQSYAIDYNKCFILTNDVDLENLEFYNSAISNSSKPFIGVFDGNDHKIYNFAINGRTSGVGLFGYIGAGGVVKNLKIEQSLLQWYYQPVNQWDPGIGNFGILVGTNFGDVNNCHVTNCAVTCDDGINVGGLAGANYGNIKNSTVDISFFYFIYSFDKTLTNIVGGLVGFNNGNISCCYSSGNVEGYNYVGGIAGRNCGNINNCWSKSFVKVNKSYPSSSGGLVAHNNSSTATITNCFSLSIVPGGGGLVGRNQGGSVNASFWDVNYTNCTTSSGGTGLTTAQMQDRNTFINAGWDFVGESANGTEDFWKMDPNIACYPKFISQFYNYYSGGAGTPANPFKISSKDDLFCLAEDKENYSKNYILTNDINLADTVFQKYIIGPNDFPFKGTFDGDGHKIVNLNIQSLGIFGFFGCIGSNSVVKNLGIEDCNLSLYPSGQQEGAIGALAGKNNYGNIINCFSTGKIHGYSPVGGLVGLNNYGNISNSFSKINVKANQIAGGLVGLNIGLNSASNISGNITNCFCEGTIEGNNRIGGLVGQSTFGKINSSFTKVNVICRIGTGGLIGDAYYTLIKNCYSSYTSIIGTDFSYAGGLAGSHNHHLGITKSYSATNINRLIGNITSSNLSFWDAEIADGNPVGTGGKTTAEMQTLSTFTDAGWDFSYTDGNEAVWFMPPDDYPILTWQISPVDIYTDGKNNFKDFTILAAYWMRDDCAIYNNYCDWADLDFTGSVDIDDLYEFLNYWLQEGIYE